ncbi:type II toxin-antitoxin system RelE/ParE family toxin [Caulobacter sp. DWR1-3-2b1]|uniref:type II toxin-antitoxin system RelE/ParE family toxin n=1 Tax=Caulobacter sp. DWR1-3-2b1 TaxID=2804670 RepID=UPI003CF995A3
MLTRHAQRDMLAATHFIAGDGPRAARKFQATIGALLVRIGDFPDIGVERADLVRSPYRVAIIHGFPYLAIYHPAHRPPRIARIIHGSQDLTTILESLPLNDA